MKFAWIVLALAGSWGCSAQPAAVGPEHNAHDEHAEEGEHEHDGEHGHAKPHEKLSGAMKSFHDVLAPVYHADKGPARVDSTCAQDASLKSEALKIAAEPAGDVVAWKKEADVLSSKIDLLERSCAGDKAAVDSELEAIHDAFHKLMELQSGEAH